MRHFYNFTIWAHYRVNRVENNTRALYVLYYFILFIILLYFLRILFLEPFLIIFYSPNWIYLYLSINQLVFTNELRNISTYRISSFLLIFCGLLFAKRICEISLVISSISPPSGTYSYLFKLIFIQGKSFLQSLLNNWYFNEKEDKTYNWKYWSIIILGL